MADSAKALGIRVPPDVILDHVMKFHPDAATRALRALEGRRDAA